MAPRRHVFTALLAIGVLAFVAGLLQVGRAQGPSDATFREAVLGRPVRINPLAAASNQAEADLVQLVFAGLMRLRADGTPEPALAERWEVTPDGLTYTFHLRPDATWHDGAAVSAHDVAFTIERIQAEDFGGPEALRAQWADTQVFVADDRTVLIHLPEPAADFLARATLGLVPEHLAGEMDIGGSFAVAPFDRAPVGAGPYRLTDLDAGRAVLRHNTSYVLGTPPLREIVLRFAETDEERRRWLAEGDVDAALFDERTLEEDVASLVASTESLDATPLTAATLTVLYFNNRRVPLDDAATRVALAASVDPATAIDAARVAEVPATGVFPPGSWAYPIDEGAPAAPPDDLWAAAGWERGADGRLVRDGEPLALELTTNGEPNRIALAEAIVGQLEAAGVTVELVTAPAQRVVTDYLSPGTYDLALFGWQLGDDPDPYGGWHTSQLGAGNVAWYSDPESDALLEVARTTLDTGERRELYTLFVERFVTAGASLVVGHPQLTYVHSADLEGADPDRLLVGPEQRFADVHRWRLAP